jgi:hypothetical protein
LCDVLNNPLLGALKFADERARCGEEFWRRLAGSLRKAQSML